MTSPADDPAPATHSPAPDETPDEDSKRRWQEAYDGSSLIDRPFETMSGVPVDAVYGESPYPGQYPYTRGIFPAMYRSRLWTMRMFAGFGTAEDTNSRFKDLLRHGGSGLSTAFDMPSLMGWDSDSDWSFGEVGRAGVAIDTLADMEDLFADIDLSSVSTSMTINGPAIHRPGVVHRGRRASRRRPPSAERNHPERHLEGVPGPEGVHLPASTLDAHRHRHGEVHDRRDAEMASDLDLGISHP